MFEKLFKYPWELYAEGRFAFSTRMPVEVRLLLLVAAATLAWYLYRQSRQSLPARKRNILTALRTLSLIVLLLMVLGPALRLPKQKDEETFVALMLDVSRSMSIEDAAGSRPRFAAARELLLGPAGAAEDGGLSGELSRQCALRVFGFDEEARRLRVSELKDPEGDRTNLFRSVRDVEQELRGVPLAAVVLLGDGGHNTGGLPLDIARHLKTRDVKLFCVGYGSANPPRDYEVVRVAVPREVRRNTTVDAFATVRATGFTDDFTVYLREAGEEGVLSTMKVRPEPGQDMYRIRFRFYPEKVGSQKYEVFVKPDPVERLTDNNRQEFVVEVKENRLPVLYVEGSPRTEFRFIRRALFRDPDFRIVSWLRTGAGTGGEAHRYIQGAEDMPELAKGFPKTKELLYKFEAVILGDIESGFFTKEQLALLEEFVRERGGGFAMLGGVNSFNLGGYAGTPVEKMLPVTLSRTEKSYSPDLFKLIVPEEALKHPILHQDDDADENRQIWAKVPNLQGYNVVQDLKSGAVLLGQHPQTGRPILAVQNYGLGRVAAFATGGSWYWRMSVGTDVEIQEKFWRQLVRWLAVGSKEKITVTLDRDIYSKGEHVVINVSVLDPSLEAVNDASVKVVVRDPFGNEEELELPWVLTQDGVYQGRYAPRDHGDYLVTVKAESEKVKAQEVVTGFSVTRPFVEFNNAGLNEALLGDMARITGGRYFAEAEGDEVADAVAALLRERRRGANFIEEKDLWDAPVFFLVLVVLLGVEWSLRRRAGLA
ncbi:MAG: glutamine amidotransferase [Planctomycetota bacterium]|nr:glutamine amidotransferase [Planctomycetota bacterium]